MTWKGEKSRHSLASRGIHTTHIANEVKDMLPGKLWTKMNMLVGKQAILLSDKGKTVGGMNVTIESISNTDKGWFNVESEYGEPIENVSIHNLDFEHASNQTYGYTHKELRQLLQNVYSIYGNEEEEEYAEKKFQEMGWMDKEGCWLNNNPSWFEVEIENYC